MDSDLSHEAINRFDAIEARLAKLEEGLGVTPGEGETEGEGEEEENEVNSRSGIEPVPVGEESSTWNPEGTE